MARASSFDGESDGAPTFASLHGARRLTGAAHIGIAASNVFIEDMTVYRRPIFLRRGPRDYVGKSVTPVVVPSI